MHSNFIIYICKREGKYLISTIPIGEKMGSTKFENYRDLSNLIHLLKKYQERGDCRDKELINNCENIKSYL